MSDPKPKCGKKVAETVQQMVAALEAIRTSGEFTLTVDSPVALEVARLLRGLDLDLQRLTVSADEHDRLRFSAPAPWHGMSTQRADEDNKPERVRGALVAWTQTAGLLGIQREPEKQAE